MHTHSFSLSSAYPRDSSPPAWAQGKSHLKWTKVSWQDSAGAHLPFGSSSESTDLPGMRRVDPHQLPDSSRCQWGARLQSEKFGYANDEVENVAPLTLVMAKRAAGTDVDGLAHDLRSLTIAPEQDGPECATHT